MRRKTGRIAFKNTLPVMAGYLVLGIGFGMVLKSEGYGFLWAFLMSFFIYAGSMQFFLVGLLTAGASLFTVALSTLLVNLRHLFYSISMVDRYRFTGKRKPYLIFALTDETYALVCEPPAELSAEELPAYYFRVSLFDQIYWLTGSLLGTLFGSILPINTEGIDFSLTALFLVVMTDQWLKAKNHFPAIAGLLSSIACLLLFGKDAFLIPSMLLITALLLFGRRFSGKGGGNE